MPQKIIDCLIINSPYEEPSRHWNYDRGTRLFDKTAGRRPAGYVVASSDSQGFDDPGEFLDIPLVNQIRPRVKAWREAGYPGITSITRRLLDHWTNPEEFDTRRFFFCQLEAAETLIWLTEASTTDQVGIEIPSDGGQFKRLCAKMATGSGKTLVMAMIIAWHILNKVTYPQDKRFAKNVLVIAPGLTVKNRLAVLELSRPGNDYEVFDIVPSSLLDKLRQGNVIVRNWHALNWESDEKIARKRGVDKRGAKSDTAYARSILGDMANSKDILVLNDEAHHAWRISSQPAGNNIEKAEIEKATKWVGGLSRIHKVQNILACYDFSATPFSPSGGTLPENALFGWIVSDFGLSDAIEAGLVKTPRVVIRDDVLPDSKTYKSRFYHIYNDPEVKDDLNRPAEEHEPLPDLVVNAYHLLSYDWRETAKAWKDAKSPTPPVMITVANRTETAARIRHAFEHQKVRIDEICDPKRILHIDSKVLKQAEDVEQPIAKIFQNEPLEEVDEEVVVPRQTQKQKAELLRQQVDTVGRQGKSGEQIQNVISVGMLSEGWDAKTVTHIMGLRAFTSQLLCEQVVGRGLRRTTYDINPETGLLEPEYVNVFGVPFTFLPHEGQINGPPPPTKPKTAIHPITEKADYKISWPNIIRIEHTYLPHLSLNWNEVEVLELDASKTHKVAELAPTVDGKPDMTQIKSIDLEKLAHEFRTQRIIFETTLDVYNELHSGWHGNKEILLGQVVQLVEQFILSDKICIRPISFDQDDLKRRLIITLNMTKVIQHIRNAIHFENIEKLEPIFDQDHPIRSTSDMRIWYTSKPCVYTKHSNINFCVCDSTWEAQEATALDSHDQVGAWVKNDHLGYEILYRHRGIVRKYRPDFLIRLKSGDMLVLEVKGQEKDQDRAKYRSINEWIAAVNAHGGFGRWSFDVSRNPGDIVDILSAHMSTHAEKPRNPQS